MRRLAAVLIAAVSAIAFVPDAMAADMPVKAPVAVAPSWTGFYVGANVGGGWGDRSVDFVANDLVLFPFGGGPPPVSFKTSGALGGLQLGYNWQLNRNWLVGLETDFDWSGIKGSTSSSGIFAFINPFTNTVDERIKWFGTVRARLGYLPTHNLLAFVTGGFAYGRVEHTGNYVTTGAGVTGVVGAFGFFCPGGGATCFAGSSNSVATGWTLGGGFEYALGQKWTLKAEYLYVSLGSKSLTETALINPGGGVALASFNANYSRTNFNVARAGLNYRF